ncbi:MAG: type II toxin-antitoxin system VapC family toxin [Verrucomicrobiales bacterium]|jgi:toxin-antitoxin system PIN domain toxin|nr:type II toxin-antitoxin system VapC family toxin [Verrucomicrobiales bacterium]
MIIPDVNLLIYAYNRGDENHPAAKKWWEKCLNDKIPIGLCWVVIGGFLRIITHQRLTVRPMSLEQACGYAEEWLRQSHVFIIHPGENFVATYFSLLKNSHASGNLTTDAHLAALAIEYQAELHSHDADFARFPGLRWINPLTVK